MDILTESKALFEETLRHRRTLHAHPEVGLCLPFACEYVTKILAESGMAATKCGEGLVTELGGGDKTLLLRADMDALPMREQSGEEFSSQTDYAHLCGHDMHTSMLLSAAKILKMHEAELPHRIRLMFQPGEEVLEGAKNMVDNGVLDGVDGALAFHVAAGKCEPGSFFVNAETAMMNSNDGFKLTVHGRGGHSAYPQLAVDSVQIFARIYEMLTELPRLYAAPDARATLTVTSFHAGTVYNVIADCAEMSGSLRTADDAVRRKILAKIRTIAEEIPKLYGATSDVEFFASVPPLVCNKALTTQAYEILTCMGFRGNSGMCASASEDFAVIAKIVPSTFIYLSSGFSDERGDFTAHSPNVRFNEDVLPLGVAALCECAMKIMP